MKDVPVACGKGCSHCCYVWVSVSAPEVLFIAKRLRRRPDAQAIRDKVVAAHLSTKDFGFEVRDEHPSPCPLLVNNLCSIYDIRPKACRLAPSGDAEVCARSYHNLSHEDIPMPMMHLMSRSYYGIALAAALKHSNLPHVSLEFNGALSRAFEIADAEARWLNGENIFDGVLCDPNDLLATDQQARMLYEHAFRERL